MSAERMDELCERAGPDGAVVFFLGRLWTFEDLQEAVELLGLELPAAPAPEAN